MSAQFESKACCACAKSKRRCERTLPSCVRCKERGISCTYLPTRRKVASSFRPLRSSASKSSSQQVRNGMVFEEMDTTSYCTTDLFLVNERTWDFQSPFVDLDFDALSSVMQVPSVSTSRTSWFVAPETWTIQHDVDAPAAAVVISKAIMKQYVAEVQSWLELWVANGKNPFIHSCLYSVKFPSCVQVAYATLASYIHRTPENTDTILQSVEDRWHDLVRENDYPEQYFKNEEQLFAQLARLHALMVYQTIGLFDGDIRLRHFAQSHIGVQNDWGQKLYHSASTILSKPTANATHLFSRLPGPCSSSQQQWHLWILAESVRRAWIVACAITNIFLTLQQRKPTCGGSIMYTNRVGLWNATSATEWESRFPGSDVDFLQRLDSLDVFDDTRPSDIDEFGTAMLSMTVHREKWEKWKSIAA